MKIIIVYGTTGGNTQLVCQGVEKVLKKSHKVRFQRCEKTDPLDLLWGEAIILASPTYGHGVLEVHFDRFFKKIQDLDLQGRKCGVIALGDPKYDLDYFLESEKILTDYFTTHQGEIIVPSLKIAKTPVTYLEKWIPKWAESFHKALTL